MIWRICRKTWLGSSSYTERLIREIEYVEVEKVEMPAKSSVSRGAFFSVDMRGNDIEVKISGIIWYCIEYKIHAEVFHESSPG